MKTLPPGHFWFLPVKQILGPLVSVSWDWHLHFFRAQHKKPSRAQTMPCPWSKVDQEPLSPSGASTHPGTMKIDLDTGAHTAGAPLWARTLWRQGRGQESGAASLLQPWFTPALSSGRRSPAHINPRFTRRCIFGIMSPRRLRHSNGERSRERPREVYAVPPAARTSGRLWEISISFPRRRK